MQQNNIIQHLLVQLLNPGMANAAILETTLEEFKKSKPDDLMRQRFGFQNLKPAILPIQEAWMDKEFAQFFKSFSTEHNLELAHGAAFEVNIYNIAQMVATSSNPIASNTAKTVLNFLDAYIRDHHLSCPKDFKSVVIKHSKLKLYAEISTDDFYNKNFTPHYLSDKDRLLISILTSDTESRGGETILSNPQFKALVLEISKKSNQSLEELIKTLDIITQNKTLNLMTHHEVGAILCKSTTMISRFLSEFKRSSCIFESTPHLSGFVKAINKNYTETEKIQFLDTLVKLPSTHLRNISSHFDERSLSLSASSESSSAHSSDYKKVYSHLLNLNQSQNADIQANITHIVKSMFKPRYDLGAVSITELCEILKTVRLVLSTSPIKENYFSTQPPYLYRQKNLTAPVKDFIKHKNCSLALVMEHKDLLLLLALKDKEVASAMINHGFGFPASFEIDNHTYHSSALRLRPEQLIVNEKNLLAQNVVTDPNITAPYKNKFKL